MLQAVDFVKGLKEEDEQIIGQLRKNIFIILRKWIQKNNGSLEDAEDIFSDTILIVFDKIKNDRLTLDCEFSTYFIAIGKHLWYKELRNRLKMPRADDFLIDGLSDTPYDPAEDIKYEIYLSLFEKLDPKSQEVMKLTLEEKSQSEIAEILDFKNAQAVADKKNSCKKKLVKELTKCKEYQELKDKYG